MFKEQIKITQEQIDYLAKVPILHLKLKKEFFDNIKSGKQIYEERNLNEYWATRLKKFKDFDGFLIKFTNGYRKDSPSFYCICLGVGMNREVKDKKEAKELADAGDFFFKLPLLTPPETKDYKTVISKILDKKTINDNCMNT